MWYVVDLLGVLSIESVDGDPLGEVVAGPFDTEREANMAYINLWAEQAQSSEVIGQ